MVTWLLMNMNPKSRATIGFQDISRIVGWFFQLKEAVYRVMERA